jgi:leucine dehydrogenase
MKVFESLASQSHERVLFCCNPDLGLKAIIAVHSTVLGPGLGGCRMWPYRNEEEALTDVLRLSRGMTYKAAAAGVNLGGAKAVILGDPKKDKTEALFRAFGQNVEALGGQYITAEDVGTGVQDMDQVHAETRWVTGVSPDLGGAGDPSPVTALGVFEGMRACAHRVFGADSLKGRSVAIQGLGSVGSYLARYLKEEGAKLFGCDVDPDTIDRAREIGVEIVPPAEIYDVDCQIFAPCALGAILNPKTLPRLKCKIVAGGANNQLEDEERDGRAIHERGILYAPDYVINAGGLINVYNELTGYRVERAMRMARAIYGTVAQVAAIAARQKISTRLAADRFAEERIARVSAVAPRHWSRQMRRGRRA